MHTGQRKNALEGSQFQKNPALRKITLKFQSNNRATVGHKKLMI